MPRSSVTVVLLTASLLVASHSARAANAAFQTFFFDVCTNPTAALAARCAETTGALGNLSGDSESSLNPSQSLSGNSSPVDRARTRSKQARERGERLRDKPSEESDEALTGPFSLLVNFRGEWFEADRSVTLDAERGFEGDTWGSEIGFDYRVSDRAFIGVLFGLESTDLEFVAENPGVNFTPAVSAGNVVDDGTFINLFGSINLTDSFFFEGGVGYVSSDFELRRNSVFQESGRVVPQTNVRTIGDTGGDQSWFAINFGFDRQHNAVTFGPYFGATYARATIDAYAEQDLNGSGLAMEFAEMERESLISHVGFRVSVAKSTNRGVVVPQFRFEYEHESDKDPELAAASFLLDAASAQYTFLGDEPDRSQFETGIGVAWVLRSGWLPFLDLEVLSGNDQLDRYRLAAGFRVEF